MSRIADFLFQGSSFFLFIFLEMICFYLIINFNSDQRAIYLETVSVYTGSVNEKVTDLTDYVNLKSKVAELQRENSVLLAQLPGSKAHQPTRVDTFQQDSLQQRYEYLPAEIINRSPYGPNNSFIINQGKGAGVKVGQGVVSGQSVVGIITAVANEHARAMSLLHRNTRLNAGLKSKHFGTLRWNGHDPRYMTLTDMKDYVEVNEKDTVYTTGYSSIFPTGLPLGTVATKERLRGTGNWKLSVKLFRDPLAIQYVYVVQNLFKEDLARLNATE
ncbi:MAG: rod shape-determining protein MreC [Bacteroidota bacterium]